MTALPALIATLLLPLNPGVDVTGYQEMVLRSLAPTPPIVVNVSENGCVTAGHVTWSCAYGNNIAIAPEARGDTPTFLHELGHQFDYAVMDGRARRQFLRVLRSPQRWQDGPNEMFAAAYSLCARYRAVPTNEDYATQYEYRPTRRQHTRTCRLIRAAAFRHFVYTLPAG